MTEATKLRLKELRKFVKDIPAEIEKILKVQLLRRQEKEARDEINTIAEYCNHVTISQEEITANAQLENRFWRPLVCPDCGKQL